MNLRCYCCGEPILEKVALVSSATSPVDRVFVMLPEHTARIEDAASEVVTRAQERTKP